MSALRDCLDELAADVGRLQRRFASNPDWTGVYVANRIAGHVEALVLMVEPTAAELAASYAPGDDEAIIEAIRVVDARWRRLRSLLGRAAG